MGGHINGQTKCVVVCGGFAVRVQSWSSGMISACHAGDPGSIPGDCIFWRFSPAPPLFSLAFFFLIASSSFFFFCFCFGLGCSSSEDFSVLVWEAVGVCVLCFVFCASFKQKFSSKANALGAASVDKPLGPHAPPTNQPTNQTQQRTNKEPKKVQSSTP